MLATGNGSQINYRDFGQGPVVVFIHEEQTDQQIWTEQIEPVVAAGFRVILADLQKSAASLDLINLLDSLGIGRAAVCSLRYSGSALNDLLVHFPHRLAGAYIAASPEEQGNALVAALQTDGHRATLVPVSRNTRLPALMIGNECHPITHQPPSGHATQLSPPTVPASKSGKRSLLNMQDFSRQLLDFLTGLAPRKRAREEAQLSAASGSA